jgi:proline dehydrogenase
MRRTISDLERFHVINAGGYPLNFRLCKGIYIEPEKIAYKGYQEVRENFLNDLDYMFRNKMYAAVATHDKYLVENAYRLIEKYNISKNMYEFQMLYGVTPDLRQSIVDKGHKMRVYVPFGKQWFNYSTRRLKENPKMAAEIIKALFVRG